MEESIVGLEVRFHSFLSFYLLTFSDAQTDLSSPSPKQISQCSRTSPESSPLSYGPFRQIAAGDSGIRIGPDERGGLVPLSLGVSLGNPRAVSPSCTSIVFPHGVQ